MTRIIKTPWYSGTVRPAREGAYRVRKSFGEIWAYWNGRTWSHGYGGSVVPCKEDFVFNEQAWPVLEWRGLQGDEHSLRIGASTYLVDFGDEKNLVIINK